MCVLWQENWQDLVRRRVQLLRVVLSVKVLSNRIVNVQCRTTREKAPEQMPRAAAMTALVNRGLSYRHCYYFYLQIGILLASIDKNMMSEKERKKPFATLAAISTVQYDHIESCLSLTLLKVGVGFLSFLSFAVPFLYPTTIPYNASPCRRCMKDDTHQLMEEPTGRHTPCFVSDAPPSMSILWNLLQKS